MIRPIVAALLLLASVTPARAELQACFTPGEDCTGLIVQEIGAAKREVLVQSYSFTSAPIAKALSDAKARGVDVRAILDKSNETARYSGATFLAHADIPVLIDDKVAIAHNKLILIDRETTIGGSFNHTKAAQEKNAENVIVMRHELAITARYVENWHRREAVSRAYAGS